MHGKSESCAHDYCWLDYIKRLDAEDNILITVIRESPRFGHEFSLPEQMKLKRLQRANKILGWKYDHQTTLYYMPENESKAMIMLGPEKKEVRQKIRLAMKSNPVVSIPAMELNGLSSAKELGKIICVWLVGKNIQMPNWMVLLNFYALWVSNRKLYKFIPILPIITI